MTAMVFLAICLLVVLLLTIMHILESKPETHISSPKIIDKKQEKLIKDLHKIAMKVIKDIEKALKKDDKCTNNLAIAVVSIKEHPYIDEIKDMVKNEYIKAGWAKVSIVKAVHDFQVDYVVTLVRNPPEHGDD